MQLARLDLSSATPAALAAIVRRTAVPDPSVRAGAADICDAVRTGGDRALRDFSDRFGGGRPGDIRVTTEEMRAALAGTPQRVVEAIEAAIDAVATVHRAQLPEPLTVSTAAGVTVERRWAPLRRVGAYVPGGKAAYPSTLVMTVVPAKIAGVAEVVVASPADGGVAQPVLLAAAALVGVDELYLMGGAQAVGALAHGTESIRPVQKIVGPGNAWVTAAKLAVFGTCSIDLPAGPSEVLVIADDTADPTLVAVDLLCQAEHGPDSPAVLVTTDPSLGDRVVAELARLLPTLERSAILAKALGDHGLIVTAPTLDAAIGFANAYAPEHASVVTSDPEDVVDRLDAVGSVYVGAWAPESAGDYATGANHVLPTGGLAAAEGPLSVADFGSWRQVQRIDRAGLEAIAPTITALAAAEGLTAHGLAATIRLEQP
jgi:histidinol dehydrogenase